MTDTPGSAKGDLIDRLRKQWKQENPELDTSAMTTALTRLEKSGLLKNLI